MKIYNKKTDKRGNKDWKKPYYGLDSRNFDYSCRHGGGCSYCSNGRQFRGKRQSANNDLKDWDVSGV